MYVEGEETQLDILELQLHLVMKHSVDAGNPTGSSAKAVGAVNFSAVSPDPTGQLFQYLGMNTFKVMKSDHQTKSPCISSTNWTGENEYTIFYSSGYSK